MRQRAKLVLTATLGLILPVNLSAIDLGPGQASASFKYGRMAAADVQRSSTRSGETSLLIRATKSFGASFDYPVASHFHLGLGADLHYCYGRLLDLTVSFKGLIASPNGKIAFRPGIGVGTAASAGASLLTVRASGEFQVSVSRKYGLGLEAGIWYTPSGGDNAQSIRIGPLKYLRGAVLFSYGKGREVRSLKLRHDPLPFQGAIKIGMTSMSKLESISDQSRKWTDRGLSVGVSGDFPAPVLAFVGAAIEWHSLGQSESLLLWGLRGSFISQICLGPLRIRPVGLIGLGVLDRTKTLDRRTDPMVYGMSLESFWDVDDGPGWLLEIQYLKLEGGGGNASVKLEPLVVFRLGMTF